ncbi:MAG TPA: CoA transferase [Acidimicrobiia bacterium]|nr:CoA transferase [Acidimicrobiia bacterium]
MRILSTGTLIAQPYAAHLAGAFGAEVIQIEHPSGTCDPWRRLDPPVQGENGVAAASSFVQERRNAFYITLDLCTPEGAELFLRLVRSQCSPGRAS